MSGSRFLVAFTLSLFFIQVSCRSQDVAQSHRRRQLFQTATTSSGGDDGGCKDYVIVCARGTGEPQTGSFAYAGLVSQVLAAVPKGNKHEIVYPASMDYFTGPSQGASDGMNFVTSESTRCPKQKYVFVGYSEGAMVITQMLNNPKLPAAKFIAAVLLGNPHHQSNAPQNQCSGKIGSGVAAMMPVKVPQTSVPKIFDCCLMGDAVCAPGSGAGAAHLGYATSPFIKDAAQFVIARLKGNSQVGGSEAHDGPSGGKKYQNTISTGPQTSSTPPSTAANLRQGFSSFPGFSGFGGFGSTAGAAGAQPQGGMMLPKFDMSNFGTMGGMSGLFG